jgi:hypothetical protein
VRIDTLTTESAEYWALPTGQIEGRLSSAPVRVQRGDEWVPVDLTLQSYPDGSVGPAAHPASLKLSGAVGDGEHDLVTLRTGADEVSLGWSEPYQTDWGMNARRFASLAGALVVAAIAALMSYSHMRSLALRYGQSELIAELPPISVDGMTAVATLSYPRASTCTRLGAGLARSPDARRRGHLTRS